MTLLLRRVSTGTSLPQIYRLYTNKWFRPPITVKYTYITSTHYIQDILRLHIYHPLWLIVHVEIDCAVKIVTKKQRFHSCLRIMVRIHTQTLWNCGMFWDHTRHGTGYGLATTWCSHCILWGAICLFSHICRRAIIVQSSAHLVSLIHRRTSNIISQRFCWAMSRHCAYVIAIKTCMWKYCRLWPWGNG